MFDFSYKQLTITQLTINSHIIMILGSVNFIKINLFNVT